MNTELLVWAALALVFYVLTRSTENILNIRQHRRDEGEEIRTYL